MACERSELGIVERGRRGAIPSPNSLPFTGESLCHRVCKLYQRKKGGGPMDHPPALRPLYFAV